MDTGTTTGEPPDTLSCDWIAALPDGLEFRSMALGTTGTAVYGGSLGGDAVVYALDDAGDEVGAMVLDPAVVGLAAAGDIALGVDTPAPGRAVAVIGRDDDPGWVASMNLAAGTYDWHVRADDTWPFPEEDAQHTMLGVTAVAASASEVVVGASQSVVLGAPDQFPWHGQDAGVFRLDPDSGVPLGYARLARVQGQPQVGQLALDAHRGLFTQTTTAPQLGNSHTVTERFEQDPAGNFSLMESYPLVPTFGVGYGTGTRRVAIAAPPSGRVALLTTVHYIGPLPATLRQFEPGATPQGPDTMLADLVFDDDPHATPAFPLANGDTLLFRTDGTGTRVHADGSTSSASVEFALATGDTIAWGRFAYQPGESALLRVNDSDGNPSHLCHLQLSP